jgi:biopolymer transport protein ExbB/TolQ
LSTLEKEKPARRGSAGLHPDAHTQIDLVAASASASRSTQAISTAQAIFQEVLEEEREAFNERVEEEIAEVEAELRKGKSWLSWLYRKSE